MNALETVLKTIDTEQPHALERLFALLRIPSISTDSAYAAHCVAAAEHLSADLASMGFASSVRPTPGHPVVLAHAPKPGAPHVLFYGHYDVQPVDPLALWETPPFEPRLAEIAPGRTVIVARGACDDKGQISTFIEALRAWKNVTGSFPVGLTVLLEGEEENGSTNLPAFVEANRAELKADLALVCDTGQWDRMTPAITTSLRGLVYEEMTVRAADRDLHSGLFGGAAQNPIHILARICAALHDDTGRIAIPGFYDGVHELSNAQKAEWADLGLSAADFLGTVGLKYSAGEKGRLLIEQIQSRPTCDVNGIWGGYQGEGSKTVIAGEAHAKVSFRLVGDQDPQKIREAFRAFVQARIPADCSVEFLAHGVAGALQLATDSPVITKARAALAAEWPNKPVMLGSGGSIPVVGDFKRLLGLDSLMIGFGLDDDRIHSPNEKYELTSFHHGTRSWARVLEALAA
jgi:acetylornithine deacetylase/succinyl-diaminopimelate desuccinylase-like protein